MPHLHENRSNFPRSFFHSGSHRDPGIFFISRVRRVWNLHHAVADHSLHSLSISYCQHSRGTYGKPRELAEIELETPLAKHSSRKLGTTLLYTELVRVYQVQKPKSPKEKIEEKNRPKGGTAGRWEIPSRLLCLVENERRVDGPISDLGNNKHYCIIVHFNAIPSCYVVFFDSK